MEKEEYTRERLIKICQKAFVPQAKWNNRDSASSQIKLGSVYALLKTGCEYEILYTKDGNGCSTNEDIIWIQFYVHDFLWFEYGSKSFDDKRGRKDHDYHFYIPTEKRLKACKGRDWY